MNSFEEFCSQFDDKQWSRLSGTEYRVAKGAYMAALRWAAGIAKRCADLGHPDYDAVQEIEHEANLIETG